MAHTLPAPPWANLLPSWRSVGLGLSRPHLLFPTCTIIMCVREVVEGGLGLGRKENLPLFRVISVHLRYISGSFRFIYVSISNIYVAFRVIVVSLCLIRVSLRFIRVSVARRFVSLRFIYVSGRANGIGRVEPYPPLRTRTRSRRRPRAARGRPPGAWPPGGRPRPRRGGGRT